MAIRRMGRRQMGLLEVRDRRTYRCEISNCRLTRGMVLDKGDNGLIYGYRIKVREREVNYIYKILVTKSKGEFGRLVTASLIY